MSVANIINMKYGISIQKNQVKVLKRIIIPGLSPTQVASSVQFGMGRPEWVKFIVSAGAHYQLDLTKPADRYELVHNVVWGVLFQALTWKRDAYERGERSGGYGIGFNQLESSRPTSYGVLQSGVTATRMYEEIFNEIMSRLEKKDLADCSAFFASFFSGPLDKAKIREGLAQLTAMPINERKKGLLHLFVSAINETLDSMFRNKTPDLLTIPTYFINIVQDMGASKWPIDNEVLSVLYSEKPGEISRGLSSFEIAALLHELLKGENIRPIALSYAVFDLARGKSPFNDDGEVDAILRDSYNLLPEDGKIAQYVKGLYVRIANLLRGHVGSKSLMTYQGFSEYLNIEKIKQQAVFWEYNLVLGELEEMLREFISSDESPPYVLQFEKRWNDLLPTEEAYWKDVVYRFNDLCSKFFNNDSYVSALKGKSGFRYDLQGWFETVRHDDNFTELKDELLDLFSKASEIGDSVEFDGKNITVNFLPTPINPLITRGAIYSWLRIFTSIWE